MDSTRQEAQHRKNLRDQADIWREERRIRLAARILRNRETNVSSAIFGTASTTSLQMQSKVNEQKPISKSEMKIKPNKTVTKSRPKYLPAPEVKQTVTSKLRMIKANPLLEVRGLVTLPSKTKEKISSYLSGKIVSGVVNKCQPSANKSLHNVSNSIKTKGENSVKRKGSNPRISTARRSLSVNTLTTDETERRWNISRSKSVADIQGHIPVITEEEDEDDAFLPLPVTPKAWQTPRRTLDDLIPNSEGKRQQTPSFNVFTPTTGDMKKKLSNWLERRGKSLQNFHHLHCFGLHASDCKSDKKKYKSISSKKNVQKKNNKLSDTPNIDPNELSHIILQKNVVSTEMNTLLSLENKENVGDVKSELIAKDALKDLINLIAIGYPWNQCEEWLALIRKSNPRVKDIPLYWECLAALEEGRGDFISAVDCYQRAIIRGASPTHVSNSFDKLMEKFDLLSIDCNKKDEKSSKTPRRQVLDARNIFKSSVIKFALQQKALKRLSSNLGVEASSLQYVVTPVRRSTRFSSSSKLTPGVTCVKSLNELESTIRSSMFFQRNNALDL